MSNKTSGIKELFDVIVRTIEATKSIDIELLHDVDIVYGHAVDTFRTLMAQTENDELKYFVEDIPSSIVLDRQDIEVLWPTTKVMLTNNMTKFLSSDHDPIKDLDVVQSVQDLNKALDAVKGNEFVGKVETKLRRGSYDAQSCVLYINDLQQIKVSANGKNVTSSGKKKLQCIVLEKLFGQQKLGTGVEFKAILGKSGPRYKNERLSDDEKKSVSNAVSEIKRKLKEVNAPEDLIFTSEDKVFIERKYL